MAETTLREHLLNLWVDTRPQTRTINAVVPQLSSTDIIDSPDLKQNLSFLRDFDATPLASGRQTQPTNFNFFANLSNFQLGFFWIPKKEPQRISVEDIDSGAWSPGGLLNILSDISPDISKALWNKLRITGTKVAFKAVDDEGNDDPQAQKFVDDALRRINPEFGGWKTLLAQMQFSIYLYGALATDSEVGLDLEQTNDLFVVSPDTIWFMRDLQQKPIPYQLQFLWGPYGRGGIPSMSLDNVPSNNMGQLSVMPYRKLNQTTFHYTPIDPAIDDPYGRGPFWPALQVVFFYAQLLRDLQRVVQNQAWGRTDFELSWEILSKMMERIAPADLNSSDKLAAFIQVQIDAIKSEYRRTAPQDAYIHPDFVKVNQGVQGARMFNVEMVVDIVRTQLVEATKEIDFFMDANSASVSEAAAATKFEQYVHSIEFARDICASHIAYHLQLNNFLHGVDTNVVAVWKPIRSTQRLADAQAESVEIGNAHTKETLGYITHDQASMLITGTQAVKDVDWDHYQPKRGPGQGEVGKGEDKNTGQDTNSGSTTAKNARQRHALMLLEEDEEE